MNDQSSFEPRSVCVAVLNKLIVSTIEARNGWLWSDTSPPALAGRLWAHVSSEELADCRIPHEDSWFRASAPRA